MKKNLSFILNNDGFIFIHVVFVISLSLLLIMTSIEVYRNDLYITKRQIDQIKYETLFQMGREEYKREWAKTGLPPEFANYSFPEGRVEINVLNHTDLEILLNFVITFQDDTSNDNLFSISHPIPYNQMNGN